MGLFMTFGVPIYASLISLFSKIGIQHALMARRKKLLSRPIDADEFIYAAEILSEPGSRTLNKGEFIIFTLLRLKVISPDEIEFLKEEFVKYDLNASDSLTLEELKQRGRVYEGHSKSMSMKLFEMVTITKSQQNLNDLCFDDVRHVDGEDKSDIDENNI